MSGVSVSGGLDRVQAAGAALEAAAAELRREADRLDEVVTACATGYWGLWTVASLDGSTGAALLSQAQDALDRVRTALAAAVAELDSTAGHLAAAAHLYQVVDRLDDGLLHDIAAAWHAVRPDWQGLLRLPGAVADGIGRGAADGAGAGWNAFVSDDPQLADTVVDANAALTAASPWWRGVVSGVNSYLHSHFADGSAVVADAGQDTSVIATRPPRDLSDVIGGLAWRSENEDEAARSGTAGGEIDVKVLHHTDGTRSVIVDIPGTRDWSTTGHDADVTGPASNIRAIRGERTAYEQGVLAALARAGVRPDDPVLLVGHSLGGMVAVTAARDAVTAGRFDVTDVITAGSPVGRTVGGLPASVRALALENDHDLVPQLDGRANPARANVVTVTGSVRGADIGADHGLPTAYGPIAAQAQASRDPAVRYDLASAEQYFDADRVQVRRFVITRSYH